MLYHMQKRTWRFIFKCRFIVSREEDKKQALVAKSEKLRLRQEQQVMEDVTVTVVQPPSILPVQLKHEIPDVPPTPPPPQQPENADEMRAEEIVDETDKENDRTLENTDNVSDNKSEKEANNRKETLPGVEKEEEPKSGEQAKRRKTPGLQVGRKSPGGVSAIKYPASILHNTYQYQRRERERRRVKIHV